MIRKVSRVGDVDLGDRLRKVGLVIGQEAVRSRGHGGREVDRVDGAQFVGSSKGSRKRRGRLIGWTKIEAAEQRGNEKHRPQTSYRATRRDRIDGEERP